MGVAVKLSLSALHCNSTELSIAGLDFSNFALADSDFASYHYST